MRAKKTAYQRLYRQQKHDRVVATCEQMPEDIKAAIGALSLGGRPDPSLGCCMQAQVNGLSANPCVTALDLLRVAYTKGPSVTRQVVSQGGFLKGSISDTKLKEEAAAYKSTYRGMGKMNAEKRLMAFECTMLGAGGDGDRSMPLGADPLGHLAAVAASFARYPPTEGNADAILHIANELHPLFKVCCFPVHSLTHSLYFPAVPTPL
jgi:hypothetical protein